VPKKINRLTICLALAGGVFLGAGPAREPGADELIRRASALYLAGNTDEADRLYALAEEKTTDPGLVAFDRAAVLFQKGDYRAAELHYARVLADASCPPERAARAWYNRGTCLLKRGGSSSVYRSSIDCLERCLLAPAGEEPLKADARHNLELAKLLWNESRSKAGKKNEGPNDQPKEDQPGDPQPPKQGGMGPTEPGDTGEPKANQKSVVQPDTAPPPGAKPTPTQTRTPGSASEPQPLQDTSEVQALSPEDTREHLKRTAERLKKDRRDLWKALTGPERPGIMDW
jgi:tetratricopeptide (TPR) repeat protein